MTEVRLATLIPHLLYQFSSEQELIHAINELSINFTRERDAIGRYKEDVRLTAAYTAFYLLTNIPKLAETFKWFPTDVVTAFRASHFIDVGAGPGTFSIAWRELTGKSSLQLETSPVMRQASEKLWRGLYPDLEPLRALPPGPRLLFFGHSANEMKLAGVRDYVERYQPEHVLFIEPGTREFFADMLEIRDHLLGLGYQVLYPCPSGEACPMRGTTDWCHQFIHVRQDAEVERLSQMARKDRRHLPLTVQAFSRTLQSAPGLVRIVRVHPETKFSFEWDVCETNTLVRYQVMKRNLSREEEKHFAGVLAGAAVTVEVEKLVGATKRVKVTKIS